MVVLTSRAERTAAGGEECCDTSSRKKRLQENSARCHWLEEECFVTQPSGSASHVPLQDMRFSAQRWEES